ncbi:MAG: DedA family protein [Dehalococcoidia bacterium]|nr:DedA family protein [Dehalococcoidia bacterium]
MTIESLAVPIPTEVIMPLAGWMLVQWQGLGWHYTLWAGFCGGLGCVIGSSIFYLIGLKGGRALVERYGNRFFVSHGDIDRAHGWFEKHGEVAIFFSRFIPILNTWIGIPAGTAKMNFPKFLLYTLIGSSLYCSALAYGGYKLGENWNIIREVTRPFDIPVAIVIVVVVAVYLYQHKKKTSH